VGEAGRAPLGVHVDDRIEPLQVRRLGVTDDVDLQQVHQRQVLRVADGPVVEDVHLDVVLAGHLAVGERRGDGVRIGEVLDGHHVLLAAAALEQLAETGGTLHRLGGAGRHRAERLLRRRLRLSVLRPLAAPVLRGAALRRRSAHVSPLLRYLGLWKRKPCVRCTPSSFTVSHSSSRSTPSAITMISWSFAKSTIVSTRFCFM
jgi:hypothetical protein